MNTGGFNEGRSLLSTRGGFSCFEQLRQHRNESLAAGFVSILRKMLKLEFRHNHAVMSLTCWMRPSVLYEKLFVTIRDGLFNQRL